MQCITYGTVVFVMLILTYVVGVICTKQIDFSDSTHAKQCTENIVCGGGLVGLAGCGLMLWWLLGLTNDCKKGYFLNPNLQYKE